MGSVPLYRYLDKLYDINNYQIHDNTSGTLPIVL